MSCSRCNRDYGDIEVTLTDAYQSTTFCPNCLLIAFQENEIAFLNNMNWYDDISGKRGAVEYRSGKERYMLERRAMMRLISRNLRKKEWSALVEKHGANQYMLHSDFYAEDGTSLQPIK